MERHSVDHVNAEAGPSRVNAGTSSTPPTTPSKSTRRRSWFGFASPSNLITSTQTHSPKIRKGSRGGDEGSDQNGVEEVELEVAHASRSSDISQARIEEASSAHEGGREEKEELMTIDGAVDESTTRKKKTKRRSMIAEDSGEVLRLEDLSGKSSRETTLRRAHDPGGNAIPNVSSLHHPYHIVVELNF